MSMVSCIQKCAGALISTLLYSCCMIYIANWTSTRIFKLLSIPLSSTRIAYVFVLSSTDLLIKQLLIKKIRLTRLLFSLTRFLNPFSRGSVSNKCSSCLRYGSFLMLKQVGWADCDFIVNFCKVYILLWNRPVLLFIFYIEQWSGVMISDDSYDKASHHQQSF